MPPNLKAKKSTAGAAQPKPARGSKDDSSPKKARHTGYFADPWDWDETFLETDETDFRRWLDKYDFWTPEDEEEDHDDARVQQQADDYHHSFAPENEIDKKALGRFFGKSLANWHVQAQWTSNHEAGRNPLGTTILWVKRSNAYLCLTQ